MLIDMHPLKIYCVNSIVRMEIDKERNRNECDGTAVANITYIINCTQCVLKTNSDNNINLFEQMVIEIGRHIYRGHG